MAAGMRVKSEHRPHRPWCELPPTLARLEPAPPLGSRNRRVREDGAWRSGPKSPSGQAPTAARPDRLHTTVPREGGRGGGPCEGSGAGAAATIPALG